MMAEQNVIKVNSLGPVCLLDVHGDVTAASEPFFNSALTSLDFYKFKCVLLGFKETTYINSGGIAVLIQLLVKAKQKNQQVGITGISDHFKKIFQMVGITKFAKIYESIEDAVKEAGK